MLGELQQLFDSVTGNTEIKLTEKLSVRNDLGLTSLGLITLVSAIEEKYGIEIPNSRLRRIKSVGDVLRCIEEQREK